MEVDNSLDYELEQTVLNLGIPPCPNILLSISAEVKKEEPDLQKIEKLICADVGLSASLIKTVNSPFYGLRTKVQSVMQAIHMLGLSHLSLMVTGMVLRDALNGMSKIDMGRFWNVSTKIAIISAYIVGRLPYLHQKYLGTQMDKDQVYTYGLFQDCGIPIMLMYQPEYKETLRIANKTSDQKFTDIEDVKYVNNHTMIGFMLARSWGLPEHMVQAIRYHHEHEALTKDPAFLSAESRDFIALALLSERAIQVITGLYQTCEWEKGREWVMQHFGLTDEDFESIMEGIRTLSDEGNLNF
jgi:HD-like signal output (HDOD) protein